MNISIREIYWALVLMSIVSSLLYLTTTISVKANSIDLDNATTIVNDVPDHIIKDLKKLSFTSTSTNELESVEERSHHDEKFASEQKQELVAEIHSSFDETVSSSSGGKSVASSADSSEVVQPVPQAQVSNKLSETGQAVVFTLVDSAAVELQQRAASAPQQTESLGLSDNLTATLPPVSSGDHGNSLTSIKDEGKGAENLSHPEVDNETRAKVDEQYVVRAEPKVVEKKDSSAERREDSIEMVGDAEKTEIVPEEVVPVANGSFGDGAMQDEEHTDHSAPEDMPVFSEWTQKQLADAEEKKKVNNETAVPAGGSSQTSSSQKMLKLHSKNYASPDCGAKIVATNPEALSAGSVLSPSRDEYVLNTCTSRIWFVVELCEGIQAKKIDLANFELFSSSPRDFSVYVSDRFPSRDWRSVGQFTAEDERTIQSFNLNPHQFGKFIKVELHSHYGSEHFCPISLFRAYGTSEFEVLDTVDEVHETVTDIDDDDDDDLDGALDINTGIPPQNLFDSARDAVLSIVKKAAEALGKGGKASNDTDMLNLTSEDTALETNHPKLCKSPRHIVVCDNCSNALYDNVYELLSCQEDHLQMLMCSSFVSDVIRDSELCSPYGLFFTNQRLGAPYPLRPTSMLEHLRTDPGGYVSALFPPKYIAALCNMLAIFEKKVALNISDEPNTTTNLSDGSEQVKIPNYLEQGFENVVLQPVATCSIDNSVSSRTCTSSEPSVDYNVGLSTSAPPLDSSSTESSVASQINPTKTMVNEDDRQDTFPSSLLSSSMVTSVETVVAETLTQDVPASVQSATTVVKTSDKIGPGEAPGPHSEGIPEIPDIAEAKESDLPQAESSENVSETASVEDQEQLALDTLLLLDLKDLDQAGDSSSAPTVTTTTTVAPPISAPAQKESVFLRLANRIKALERNMSLSGQYLEELSRRYKKQMEEMQRAFNRTLAAVGEESRRGEEREQRRSEEMLSLQQHLASLSSAVEGLLSERDSWLYRANVIIQHVIFISAEVLIFVMILYFCRRIPTPPVALEEKHHRKPSVGVKNRKSSKVTLKRRKSVEGVSGHESPRVRNRRPSEEALNIAGTYRELLIAETAISELDAGVWTVSKAESKRRRRKKKDLLLKSSSVNLVQKPNSKRSTGLANNLAGVGQSINAPTRRVSSSEVGKWWDSVSSVQVKEEPIARTRWLRQESAPEPFVSILEPPHIEEIMVTQVSVHSSPSSTSGYIVERTSSVELQHCHKLHENLSPKESLNGVDDRTKEVISSNSVPALNQNNGLTRSVTGASSKPRPLSSPLFMKTAVSSRSNRRIGNSSEPSPQARLKSDNWEWYSSRHNTSAEKSSQSTQFPSALTGQNHNGQLEVEDEHRTSNASMDSEASDLTRKENNKKGGTGSLKKMVKRFF